MKVKEKKCRECKARFTPQYNSTQVVCSPSCALAAAKKQLKKEAEEKEAAEMKKMKDKVNGLPELKKLLQTIINAIARQIDRGHGCICCGSEKSLSGGHYHSVGSNSSLRFHLLDIFAQCFGCNSSKSGNIQEYDLGLIKLFGKEKWEYIKFDLVRLYPELKLSKEEAKEKAKLARAILRDLKKEEWVYSTSERWELREQVNNKLGIYQTI